MDLKSIIAGIIGGAIVLTVEQIYLYLKEKRKDQQQRLITFPNIKRIIDSNIFDRLSPGRSVELMKTALGTPDKTYQDSDPIFTDYREEEESLMVYEFENEADRARYEENKFKTTVYFYDFENAQVKITSKDREVINSLAVEVKEGTLDASCLPFGWMTDEDEGENLILGQTKVTKELVGMSRSERVLSRYDNTFVLSVYTAAPLYTHYTYFGFPESHKGTGTSKDNPESFVGSIITGVCIHRSEHDSYIILGSDNY